MLIKLELYVFQSNQHFKHISSIGQLIKAQASTLKPASFIQNSNSLLKTGIVRNVEQANSIQALTATGAREANRVPLFLLDVNLN